MKRDCVIAVHVAAFWVLLLTTTTSIYGHHSPAMFDRGRTITLQGTVTEVAWANPHSIVFFDAKETGVENATVKNWSIEGPSPSALKALGWERNTIKVGDKITVTGNPRRDGRPHVLLKELTDPNGKRFSTKKEEYTSN